jgi:hypothetical protein
MMMVMPWNFSVAALEGFLINSRYCREDIGALDKQAQILTQFADYITKEKSAFVDICIHWNRSQCNRAAGSCTSRMGTVLRHVCDMKIDRDDPSKRCEGDHQRCTFHK